MRPIHEVLKGSRWAIPVNGMPNTISDALSIFPNKASKSSPVIAHRPICMHFLQPSQCSILKSAIRRNSVSSPGRSSSSKTILTDMSVLPPFLGLPEIPRAIGLNMVEGHRFEGLALRFRAIAFPWSVRG